MRTYKIAGILLIVGALLVISALLSTFLGESPEDMGKYGTHEHSMIKSGLPRQASRILATSAAAVLLFALAVLSYIEKLDHSVTSEKHVLRLERLCRIYRYSLTVASVIFAGRILLALAGLSRVPHITFAHLLHSAALINLGALLVSVSMLLFYSRYMRAIITTPPSAILAAKRKMTTSEQ